LSIPVVGFGAGGHAKVVIEILRLHTQYELVGLLDPKRNFHGKSVLGVPVLGDDSQLTALIARGVKHFFIGLGSTKVNSSRQRLYEFGLDHGMSPVTAIHPSAIVTPSATFGGGTTVMAAAVINASARLGDNVIINSGAIVEHDCIIGSHVHITTGAKLAGGVVVGEGTHIGTGAIARQYMRIGTNVLVGAGAVVVKDVPDGLKVVGNPAVPL